MDTKYIVALEIGSSKIKGLAAAVGELGDIRVIAIEEIRVSDCVRYGKIQNVQEVSAHVNDIIRKLENNPEIAPRKITDIFVSLGGRSLSTVMVQAQAKFPNAVEITAETIDRLKRDASFGLVTDKNNLGMLPHAFFVDNSEVKKIVGTVGTHIRAEFSTIVISPAICRNLELIKFDDHSLKLINVVRPIALTDLVLTASEKQLGCALVDCGAETTTITIYKDDALQSIVTLPIGSRNITRDLMAGLNMTEESAEMAKARSGSAITSDASSADIEVNNYISARAGEIVANILHQIELAGFRPQSLPAGIILTGGGARLRNFDRLIENQSKMPVRMAAIDSSLKFKGNNLDRNANIDILAITGYAADNYSVDCLTAAPEPLSEPTATLTENQTDYDNTQRPMNNRRQYIDDDSLLEDDNDDVDTDGSPAVHVRNSKRHSQKIQPDFDSYENGYDDDSELSEKNGSSLIDGIKRRLAKFWNDPRDTDDDDLDAPAD